MSKLSIFVLVISFTFLSCQKEEFYTAKHIIDPEFQPYFNTFLSEAKARNIVFKENKNITIEFSETLIQNKYQAFAFEDQRKIQVFRETWNYFNNDEKETLILHELGHLILKRVHDTNELSNGETKSLMVTSEGQAEFNLPIHTGIRKKHYFDELFNRQTNIPAWANHEELSKQKLVLLDKLIFKQDFLNFIIPENLQKIANKKNEETLIIKNILEGDLNVRLLNFGYNQPLPKSFQLKISIKGLNERSGIGFSPTNGEKNDWLNFQLLSNGNAAVTGYAQGFIHSETKSNKDDWNLFLVSVENNQMNVWLNNNHLFQTDYDTAKNNVLMLFLSKDSICEIDNLEIYGR